VTIVLRDEASDLFQLFINKDDKAYLPVSCLLLYQDPKGEGFRIVNWGTEVNLATGDLHTAQYCFVNPFIVKRAPKVHLSTKRIVGATSSR
jgi:hypothetical protein